MTQQRQPVKLSEIVMNAGTQMRAWMDTNTIAEYTALMKEGVQFDPIEVYLVDNRPVLVDGFHRVNAAIKAGKEALDANIVVGTMEQAIWASIAANKKNALKRNSSDIQKAIEAALLHALGAGLSDRQIAEHVGCSHPTVGSVRAKLVATGKLTSSDVRTGKDGRAINTAKIGVKHQLEHWHELVYAPWMQSIPDKADLVLIHKDDEYLHLLPEKYDGRRSDPLPEKRYHLTYHSGHLRGLSQAARAIRVDSGYVDLFEEDGLKVYVAEFKDLPDGMQRVVKAILAENNYYRPLLFSCTRVDPQLQVGDKVARLASFYRGNTKYPVIANLVGVSKSFVHVRVFGSTKDEIWYGHQLVSVDSLELKPGGWELQHDQWSTSADMSWGAEYTGLKQFYAQNGTLFAHSSDAYIALGDDALTAALHVGGIAVQDDHFGPVFITFDVDALKAFVEKHPVAIYRSDRETVRNFWQQIVAGQGKPAAPEPPPAPPVPDDDAGEASLPKWPLSVKQRGGQHVLVAADEMELASFYFNRGIGPELAEYLAELFNQAQGEPVK